MGRSVQFRFLTADGIQSTRASFAAPFSRDVWLTLGCATIFLLVCIVAVSSHPFTLSFTPKHSRRSCSTGGESHNRRTSFKYCKRSDDLLDFRCHRDYHFYRSKMKFNYMIEPKFVTRWKTLREIENFTLIYGESFHDQVWCDIITRGLEDWKLKLIICQTGNGT